eukprot:GFKZ01011761.1.p2 GENE.GFKZ01011761.1~~GFKZ01011761.1.p2  ORF type:complete len:286 (-),score=22.17 GFKZ01011761.1:1769-2626(-)
MTSHPKHLYTKSPSRSSDTGPFYSLGSASSSKHSHRDIEMKTNSSSSYWETVIIKDADNQNIPHRPRSLSKASPRECTKCDRTFTTTRAYEEHDCPADKPYRCEECGTGFKKNSNLAKHMKLVHRRERNFQCTEEGCGRLFGQKSNLNSHIKAVHLKEKPYPCEEPGCGKKFSQKSGLKAHVKTVHRKERPFECEECGSSFGHRGDLNRHVRVLHKKERPFICEYCPDRRAFGRRSVLTRHLQTHSEYLAKRDASMSEASASSHRRVNYYGDRDVHMSEASSSSR